MGLKDSLMWTGAPAVVVRSERLYENVSVVSNSPNRKTSLWKVYYEFSTFLPFQGTVNQASNFPD